ncbi:S8 family serine peptidase [Salipiger sp. P9]|uniref:S8 family serine peptidase n=1 Tax=Salipiger pentaromativorans TaxID=2943193 RepID=UPI002157272A|nr:S8 family serine peptidase [Salipiger pentaromativorans]MCR8549294.1 S8 family serine peptidase [Salipiger pentaromativorans]
MVTSNTPILNPTTREPEGVDSYPEYPALWPLLKIGVVSDAQSFASPAWDAAEAAQKTVTVALIDTSVAWENPCLYDAVDRARLADFSVDPEGVFPVPDAALTPPELAQRQALPAAAQLPQAPERAAVRGAFSGHGTAMAGLIGGRPPASGIRLHRPARYAGQPASSTIEDLPFAGVNPYCRIVPISTTSEPNPVVLKNAFTYAQSIGADVIVFATALEPVFPPAGGIPAPDANSAPALDADLAIDAAVQSAWQALDDKIREIGQQTHIVCAAGNTGETAPTYPARLSDPTNLIVSVGALTSEGGLAPYSTAEADVYAPSGDAGRLDREAVRLDPYSFKPFGLPANASGGEEVSFLDLISTDVPGPFGYNPSPHEWEPRAADLHLDLGSLFCRFSGTSGATAIAGGLIALALQLQETVTVPKKAAGAPPALLTIADLWSAAPQS